VTRVAILGAGPAGLGAALELARRGVAATVFEQREVVGGNAGSFEIEGLRVDYGSHRLHPAADAEVMRTIQELLGPDLLARPRHGRIRLQGRWLHFPLRAGDLALRVPPRFAAGVALDLAAKLRPRRAGEADADETFASVLARGLGRTICEEFYFPYARKVWGMEPDAMSAIQAKKRVSSASIGKMLKRLLPGGAARGGAGTKGIFYYPRHGYGQICDAIARAAQQAGAEIALGARVRAVRLGSGEPCVAVERDGAPQELRFDHVWSTIPVTALARLLEPAAPDPVQAAARALRFRAMLLVYLVLEQDRFSEYDAHYFPGADLRITRLSEPKIYADLREPRGRTVLCAELPCQASDGVWSLTDEALALLVREDLARSGIPVDAPVRRVVVKRLPHAYPLYPRGYEAHFDAIDAWLAGLPNLLTFGRQGLYAHDNTHHALYMAKAAARCLRDDGTFDSKEWEGERRVFETHVVED
jgi:protoporphyrinogen oxidase